MFLQNLRKFAIRKSIILFVCFFVNQTIFSEGFLAGTLVKTTSNYKPIEQLKENDLVTSFNFKDKILVDGKITKIIKKHYTICFKLTISGKEIICAPDHKFYCPLSEKDRWIKAKDLKPNDFISSNLTDCVRIDSIIELNQEEDFYCLSIEKYQNYFVSEKNIFVHNFVIWLPVFEIVIGGGFKWLLSCSAVASAFAGLAIVNIAKNNGVETSGLKDIDLKKQYPEGIRYQPEGLKHLDFDVLGYENKLPLSIALNYETLDENKKEHIFGLKNGQGSKHGFINGPNDEDPETWWKKIIERVKEAYSSNEIKGEGEWKIIQEQKVNPNFGDLVIEGIINSGIIDISTAYLKSK